MEARQGLPEDDPDGPDVCRPGRLGAVQPLGRDVGERAGDVSGGGQPVELVEARKAEVEEPRRGLRSLLEHDVGRLDVAVRDPLRVRVPERVEDLNARLDGGRVVDPARAEGVTERPATNVFVGDVDVTVVPVERERAEATRVAKPRRRLDFPLGP